MDEKIKLDPFSYGGWDIATTLIQLATAIAGIVLAMNGNTAGLLALGSLAGGVRGNVLGDFLKMLGTTANTNQTPKGPGLMTLLLLIAVLGLAGCGTISKQFLVDSRTAMLAEAGDYLSGCKQVTVAPAFSVDATDSVTYGGGVFAGCEENGRLAEFHCDATLDTTTGKTRMTCAPLSLWKSEKSEK